MTHHDATLVTRAGIPLAECRGELERAGTVPARVELDAASGLVRLWPAQTVMRCRTCGARLGFEEPAFHLAWEDRGDDHRDRLAFGSRPV